MSEPLPAVEYETGPQPSHGIIWLHGLGADGHDFESLVPELVMPSWPALRFVFPHAPVRPVTLNGGAAMRAWYDITHINLQTHQDEVGMRASISTIEAWIARENARGIADEHLILAGFSQGGAIALASGLRHPHRLGGIVALSTYLVLAAGLAAERSEASLATPVFQSHGRLDTIVRPSQGRAAYDQLTTLGYQVQWHDYPMAHTLCAREVDDLRHWLDQRLVA